MTSLGFNTRSRRFRAFTIIELMLAIAIMGFIVFALFKVFNETQRAMRSNQTSSEVGEKARAILEMVSREIEQVQPVFSYYVTNFNSGPDYAPLVLMNPDRPNQPARTNSLYSVFFPLRATNQWSAVGYRVDLYENQVGSLVRFSTTNVFSPEHLMMVQSNAFQVAVTNTQFYHHVADGVVHFRIATYGRDGAFLGYSTTNRYSPFRIHRAAFNGSNMGVEYSDESESTNATIVLQAAFPNDDYETISTFRSNAVPAYVEL